MASKFKVLPFLTLNDAGFWEAFYWRKKISNEDQVFHMKAEMFS
jgi:hypothetical protein